MTVPTTVDAQRTSPSGKFSTLDRFLPVWIGGAMLVGRGVPGLGEFGTESLAPDAPR